MLGTQAVRSRTSGTIVLAVAAALSLTALGALIAVGISNVLSAQRGVEITRQELNSYANASQAISREAFAEAAYLRAPNDAAWANLETAIAEVPPAIDAIKTGGDRREEMTLSTVRLLNDRYVAQLRRARDEQTPAINDRVAGPALDAMNRLVEAERVAHRDQVTKAMHRQASILNSLCISVPIVFTIAFALLAWTTTTTVRDRKRMRNEVQLNKIASQTDALTALPNRRALAAAMAPTAPRDDRTPAVLFLDLDNFKPVNDTWGHPAGDTLLQLVARRLERTVRTGDTLARLGGDEFAIYLPDARDAQPVADRVLEAFCSSFELDGHDVRLGVSIGIALQATPDASADDLLHAADQALYAAKHNGRGGAVTALTV